MAVIFHLKEELIDLQMKRTWDLPVKDAININLEKRFEMDLLKSKLLENKYDKTCDLCVLKIRDNTYKEDERFIILDCKDHHIPMAVLKNHRARINIRELSHLISLLYTTFAGKIKLDSELGTLSAKVPQHWHCHIYLDP